MKETQFQLYDRRGRRKFLTADERRAFLDAADSAAAHERTLCLVLNYTGCHVTEALQLTAASVDLAGDAIIIGEAEAHLRGVPVPAQVLQALDIIHCIRRAQKAADGGRSAKLWPVDRTTAWRWVRRIMKEAGIEGPQAAPRGLRHGFAVEALTAGVPLEIVQQWMGYKDLDSAKKCYADFVPITPQDHG